VQAAAEAARRTAAPQRLLEREVVTWPLLALIALLCGAASCALGSLSLLAPWYTFKEWTIYLWSPDTDCIQARARVRASGRARGRAN